MKIKKCLAIPGLLLLGINLAAFDIATPLIEDVEYTSDLYGPFFYGETERTLHIEYTYHGNYILEAYEEVLIEYHDNFTDNYVFDYKSKTHSLIKNKTYSYNFTFSPTSCINYTFGATFEFRVINLNTNEKISLQRHFVEFSSITSYSAMDIAENPIISPFYSAFVLGVLKGSKQQFDFSETTFMCKDSPNLYLDVSSVSFLENSTKELSFTSCFAKIANRNDVFVNIEKQGDFVFLPLDIKKDGKTCYFEFKDLYVDPSTLLVSLNPISGYVPTRKLYFPLDKYQLITPFQFEIMINGLGVAKSNVSIVVDYYPTGNFIGDCSNSDFCLIGGVSND